jgi:hypothetical protein
MKLNDTTQLSESPTAIFLNAGLFATVLISMVALFSLI